MRAAPIWKSLLASTYVRAAVGVALVIVVAAAAVAQTTGEVARPSPTPVATASPTPSPTASPSPSPSPSPTITPRPSVAPTPRPRPTSHAAGDQLLPYYFQMRQLFPVLPPAPHIDFDAAAGDDGDAWYNGLDAQGQPIFSVREDYVMTPSTAFHEIGHAYQDVVQRRYPGTDMMAKFWAFRGFPGTWQDAQKDAYAQPPGMSQWIRLPVEMWAESFSVAMVGGGHEKTFDFGRTINPVTMKSFFVGLQTAP